MFDGLVVATTEETGTEAGQAPNRAQGLRALVTNCRERLASVVRDLEPGVVPAEEAPALWDEFDQVMKLSAAGMLVLAKRVDDAGVARSKGFRDTADYLARRAGCSRKAASRQLRSSRLVRDLPLVQTSLERGEVSLDQATAIISAAAADPEAEGRLIETARRVSLKELQDECLRVKAKADPDPDATRKRQRKERFLRHSRTPDGSFSLYAQGPPEDQGLLQAALRHGIEDRFRANTCGDDEPDTYDQRAYDALFEILRNHIEEGPFTCEPEPVSGPNDHEPADGDDRPAGQLELLADPAPMTPSCPHCNAGPPGGDHDRTRHRKRKRRRPNLTYMTLVRVDVEALNRGWQEGDEVCDMPGLGPISVPAARALLPDSVIRLILTKGEQVASVVYAGRGPNTAQKMALNWTQPICTVEGCNSQIVQADHRIDWRITRHTRLDELDHLCAHHHGLKTHKGWALVIGTGKRALVPPDDSRHPGNQDQRAAA